MHQLGPDGMIEQLDEETVGKIYAMQQQIQAN